MISISIFFIHIYQHMFSPDQSVLFFNRLQTCRFFPSCSTYTIQTLQVYGFLWGWWYGIKRVARCHPWQRGGYDPIP